MIEQKIKMIEQKIPGCESEGFPLLLYLIGAEKPRPCEVLQLSLTRAPAGPFGSAEIARDRSRSVEIGRDRSRSRGITFLAPSTWIRSALLRR